MKTKSTRKNVLISRAYSKNVKALVKKMEKDYIKELSKVNEIVFDASIESQKRITLNKLSDKWFKIFSTVAYKIAMRFLNPLFKTTLMQVKNDVKGFQKEISITAPIFTGKTKEVMKNGVNWNVSLIKSIPEQYHNKVSNIVMASFQQGGQGAFGISEAIKQDKRMMEDIRKAGYNAEKRAEIIAIDQTRKMTTNFNLDLYNQMGVKKFEWVHSHGAKEPRELHLKLDGQIFDISNPPVIDNKTGQVGYPGQLINCGCVMRGVFDV